MRTKITVEFYLNKVRKFAGSEYGKMVRSQFADSSGMSELGMLAAPSEEELAELVKAVAIMTADERERASELSDDEVSRIAADAGVDAANFAIFINGYALHCKRVS